MTLERHLSALAHDLPTDLDLTSTDHLQRTTRLAEAILADSEDVAQLDAVEAAFTAKAERFPLLLHLAVKIARSRRLLERIERPAHTSVVFAVYGEHQRILTRDEHPNGEDFLRRKIDQLEWLFDPFPHLSWSMLVVDDGCPHDSGKIARAILQRYRPDAPVQVLFLADAIRAGHPAVHGLDSTDQSRKGGSIQLGMWDAAAVARERHAIVFTDADLSTHLGQTGLLLDGILNRDRDATIGSRREPRSVVVKGGKRDSRGRLFIFLWQRLLAPLRFIIDTQCGFKAFRADVVREIVRDTIEKQFAFDIELLLRTELRAPGRIEKVPIAWIDSEALSTTTDLEPYLPMLEKVVAMYRTYLPPRDAAEPFARLLEALDNDAWNRLLDEIPAELASRAPTELATFEGVTAGQLAAIAGVDSWS